MIVDRGEKEKIPSGLQEVEFVVLDGMEGGILRKDWKMNPGFLV